MYLASEHIIPCTGVTLHRWGLSAVPALHPWQCQLLSWVSRLWRGTGRGQTSATCAAQMSFPAASSVRARCGSFQWPSQGSVSHTIPTWSSCSIPALVPALPEPCWAQGAPGRSSWLSLSNGVTAALLPPYQGSQGCPGSVPAGGNCVSPPSLSEWENPPRMPWISELLQGWGSQASSGKAVPPPPHPQEFLIQILTKFPRKSPDSFLLGSLAPCILSKPSEKKSMELPVLHLCCDSAQRKTHGNFSLKTLQCLGWIKHD